MFDIGTVYKEMIIGKLKKKGPSTTTKYFPGYEIKLYSVVKKDDCNQTFRNKSNFGYKELIYR